jgi:hypothetical protein
MKRCKLATDREKLNQVVELLAEVRTVLDGGWHYSSPLLRLRRADEGNPNLLLERADCLSMVAEVISDVDRVSDHLAALSERANALGVDTVILCGADLALLARTYKGLAVSLGNAANDAVDALTTSAPKAERKRAPRAPKASTTSSPSNQTSLLEQEHDTSSEGALP